mgnify:CR=1 FL=1
MGAAATFVGDLTLMYDVKTVGQFVKSINGTNGYATSEDAIHTFFGNYISHLKVNKLAGFELVGNLIGCPLNKTTPI